MSKPNLSRRAAAWCAALLAGLAAGAAPAGPPDTFGARLAPEPAAGHVGTETCIVCHDDMDEAHAGTAHRDAVVPGTVVGVCEACHGPGEAHVDADGDGPILGAARLRELAPDERAAMCLQCHRDLRLAWPHGPHAGSEVGCADCHGDQTHFGSRVRPAAAFRSGADFCLQCHGEAAADFRLQHHHPVLEGEMGCIDCHAPHGDPLAEAAFGEANRPCLRCHAELAGPHVFEHEATADESCTACHRPHGSPHDRLLTQDGNSLCLRCHYEPGYPRIGAVDHADYLGRRARCYDCHTEIHGSDLDEKFLEP